MSVGKEAEEFDKLGKYRRKADNVHKLLEQFRQKYPLKENPTYIEDMRAEDIFNEGKDYFFRWVVFELKDFGHVGGYPTAFRSAALNLELFRDLLRIAVSDKRGLAEKVDASWEDIKGMGGDKILAKKIICCYDDDVLPIFKTDDLAFFYTKLRKRKLPPEYYDMSLGGKYQFLNQELMKIKQSSTATRGWDRVFFMWFLYVTYKGFS